MITIRLSSARGHFDHGWLDTYHTFSFADYMDPRFMGFRSLRVINEDRIAPGEGFPTHGHRDMEIITYILAGQLQHKDSLGTGSIIRPGEVQRMTAGKGVRHSEFNASSNEPVHLLQIWILPNTQRLDPSYEQKQFNPETNVFQTLASPDTRDGSVLIHQDCVLYGCKLNSEKELEKSIAPGRHAWVQVAKGTLKVNDTELNEGDGAAIEGETHLRFSCPGESCEFLFFDLD